MHRPLGFRPFNPERLSLTCQCGKVRSSSKGEAQRRRRHAAKMNGGDNPVRYYVCSYGYWHWSSMLTPPADLA